MDGWSSAPGEEMEPATPRSCCPDTQAGAAGVSADRADPPLCRRFLAEPERGQLPVRSPAPARAAAEEDGAHVGGEGEAGGRRAPISRLCPAAHPCKAAGGVQASPPDSQPASGRCVGAPHLAPCSRVVPLTPCTPRAWFCALWGPHLALTWGGTSGQHRRGCGGHTGDGDQAPSHAWPCLPGARALRPPVREWPRPWPCSPQAAGESAPKATL